MHLEDAALVRSADWLQTHLRRLESRYRRLDELLDKRSEEDT